MKKLLILLCFIALPVYPQMFRFSTSRVVVYPTAPGTAILGDIYADSGANTFNFFNGTSWQAIALGSAGLAADGSQLGATAQVQAFTFGVSIPSGVNADIGGSIFVGTSSSVDGSILFRNAAGVRRLTLSATVPLATGNRTINIDWSGMVTNSIRTLTFPNGNVDLTPLVTPTGTGNVVLATSPTISSPTFSGVVNFTGGVAHPVNATAKVANYTTLGTDYTLLVNPSGGAFTVTLSSVNAIAGQIYIFKCTATSANAVTFSPSSGNIDNVATKTMTPVTTLESATIQFDGTNWWIVSSNVTAL